MRRNLLYISALCLLLAAWPAGQSPQTGRVIGRVRLTSKVPGKPLPSTAYPRRNIGDHDAPALPEIRNVVVYIKDAAYRGTLAVKRVELRQEHETFIPHTIAIARGSVVEFPNGDPFFHDVFSLSRSATFDLGSYPRGQTKSHLFRQAGLVKVYCHIHSHMTASIMVFDHTFFTIPKPDGSFTIDEIPAGSYQVSAWHERIGENSQPVKIEAGRASDIRFALPIVIK